MDHTPENQLHDLLKAAQCAGADAVQAVADQSESTSVAVRHGKLETVQRQEADSWTLQVWVGARSASLSAIDLGNKAARDDLVARTLVMARAASEDPYSGLAPADLVCSASREAEFALDLNDPTEFSAADLERSARDSEAAALAIAGVTNSEGGRAAGWRTRGWQVTSEGLVNYWQRSAFNVGATVVAGRDKMEVDGFGRSARWRADLPCAESIGAEAGRRAVAKIGARKLASTRAPVIFERRLAINLLEPLLNAISGGSIARGTSFLKHRLGEPVFASNVRIFDDPTVVRGQGSRVVDGEGVLTPKRAIVDNGVLSTWLLDVSSARQLGLTPNGYGRAGTSNLSLLPGSESLDDLMRQAGSGLLVTGMFGPSLNMATGDWSAGVYGIWFERGEPAFPVSEITVAGSLPEFYARMVPASDLEVQGAANAPSLLVDDVAIAGS
jgi:PmbA protein